MHCAFCMKWGAHAQDYFENLPICDECVEVVAKELIKKGKEDCINPKLLERLRKEEELPSK